MNSLIPEIGNINVKASPGVVSISKVVLEYVTSKALSAAIHLIKSQQILLLQDEIPWDLYSEEILITT